MCFIYLCRHSWSCQPCNHQQLLHRSVSQRRRRSSITGPKAQALARAPPPAAGMPSRPCWSRSWRRNMWHAFCRWVLEFSRRFPCIFMLAVVMTCNIYKALSWHATLTRLYHDMLPSESGNTDHFTWIRSSYWPLDDRISEYVSATNICLPHPPGGIGDAKMSACYVVMAHIDNFQLLMQRWLAQSLGILEKQRFKDCSQCPGTHFSPGKTKICGVVN